jgi:hypothetical protein
MSTPNHGIKDIINFGRVLEQTDTNHQAHRLGRAVWRIIDILDGRGLLPESESSSQGPFYDIAWMAPVTITPTVEASFVFRASPALRAVEDKNWALSAYNGLVLEEYATPEAFLDVNQRSDTETSIILKPRIYTPRPNANRDRPYHARLETPHTEHELFGPHVDSIIVTLGQIAEHYATLPGRHQLAP